MLLVVVSQSGGLSSNSFKDVRDASVWVDLLQYLVDGIGFTAGTPPIFLVKGGLLLATRSGFLSSLGSDLRWHGNFLGER